MSQSEAFIVIDEGSAQSVATFMREGKVETVIVPSRAAEQLCPTMDGFSPSSYETEDGEKFTVNGELDSTVMTNIPSYQTSGANRAIIHETLRQAGFAGQNVKVAVTLPVGRFFGKGSGPRDEALIDAKRKSVMSGIRAANGSPVASIVECVVYPEALPALFEISRDEKGVFKQGFSETDKVLVIDIGGATTDISIVTPNGDIEGYESLGNCGVLDVAARLSDIIATEFSIESKIPASLLDRIIRERTFAGESVSDQVEKSCTKTLSEILRTVEKMVSNPGLLDKVMIVGGGALLMGERLGDMLGVAPIIPENADEVISKGIFKLEMLKHGQTSSN
ncbi:plasmid segregation protein ParM domain-containing protein [Endozoicomonas sp. ALC066]|uniref:plasmid segregation protein ParM domain-containing protein n=1 Tax=Endozoicomonas sp. ALC066 TaxID=3403078 RepID=UPI003BB4D9FF